MEYRDLYNENRIPLFKTIKKGEKPEEGMYYVSVAVALENTDGTFLLQKRSLKKGGLWGTVSGHPKSGETSLEGILTEIKEEMGLEVPILELIRKQEFHKKHALMMQDCFTYLETNQERL